MGEKWTQLSRVHCSGSCWRLAKWLLDLWWPQTGPWYLQFASVARSWAGLWTFSPSCTVWRKSRRPLCLGLPALYSRGPASGPLSLPLAHSNGGWSVLGCLTPTSLCCMKLGRAVCVSCACQNPAVEGRSLCVSFPTKSTWHGGGQHH